MDEEEVYLDNLEFIQQVARKYARKSGYRLSTEDLEGEAALVLAQLFRREVNASTFENYYRRSVVNRFRDLLYRAYNRTDTEEIDLRKPYRELGASVVEKIYLEERINALKELISEFSWQVLQELLNPSKSTEMAARNDFFNRRHRDHNATFYVGPEHIAQALGVKKYKVTSALFDIRYRFSQVTT